MLEAHPELFSNANVTAVKAGFSPRVDETWIRYHPNHASFNGDKLVHHHVEQGAVAVGLPEQIHQKWSGDLHPQQ